MSTKKIKLTSGSAIAVFPRLNRPDTKYNEHGTYSADARFAMGDPTTKPMLKQISDEYKAHTGQDHPKKPVRKDKEAVFYFDQNDDGSYVLDFVTLKLRAKNVMTRTGEVWDRKPKLFDAKGKPLNADLKIGGGSTIKVAFEIDNGTIKKSGDKFTRLIPTAVQIIDLVEFGDGASASSYGFGEEEGFEGSETTFPDTTDKNNGGNPPAPAPSEGDDADEGFY